MKLPDKARYIISALQQKGFLAYAVGGCVRDSLLGKEPHDCDIATDAKPSMMREVFAGHTMIDTGERYGTLTLLLEGEPFELTTFRTEGRYSDARHPDEVVFNATLREDLSRRDFTINALAFTEQEGLIDPFGGREDLQNRLVRCVGRPAERFREDPLRILRAARFAFALGFEIEPETRKAMKEQKNLLLSLATERVREELSAILTNNEFRRPYLEIAELLCVIIPELEACFACFQGGERVYTVGEHLLKSVGLAEALLPLRLTMLLHDIGKPRCLRGENGQFPRHAEVSACMAAEILQGLKFPRSLTEQVEQLILYHHAELAPEPPALRKLLSQVGEKTARLLLRAQEADLRAQEPPVAVSVHHEEASRVLRQILDKEECFSLERLAVNGDDLLALGFPQGAELGRALRQLLELVLETPELNTRTQLLALARKRLECDFEEEE